MQAQAVFFDIFKHKLLFGGPGLRPQSCARCHVSLRAGKGGSGGAARHKIHHHAKPAPGNTRERGWRVCNPRTQPRLLGCVKEVCFCAHARGALTCAEPLCPLTKPGWHRCPPPPPPPAQATIEPTGRASGSGQVGEQLNPGGMLSCRRWRRAALSTRWKWTAFKTRLQLAALLTC